MAKRVRGGPAPLKVGERRLVRMMNPQEKKLIEAAQRGDQSAMGLLLERYQDRLYRVVLRMVSHRDDAAEVTQDAMLKVIKNISRFKGDSNISTWMIRIAMNQSISHLRRRKLRKTTSLDQTPGDDPNNRAMRHDLHDSSEPPPEMRVEQSEMVEILHRALGMLAEDFRSVIVLRDIDQMDYQQIAEVLDIPTGTVKSRLFRARLALRQQMMQLCEPAPQESPAAEN